MYRALSLSHTSRRRSPDFAVRWRPEWPVLYRASASIGRPPPAGRRPPATGRRRVFAFVDFPWVFCSCDFRVPLAARGPGQDHQLTPARFRIDLSFYRAAPCRRIRKAARRARYENIRDLDSAAHLAAPPMPHPSKPGQSPPSLLLLSSLTTALSELSGAGEHTIDRASGVQEQASERPPPATVLC